MRSLFVAAAVFAPSLVASLAAAQPAYPAPGTYAPDYAVPAAPQYAPGMTAPGMTAPSDIGVVEPARHSSNDYEPGIVPEGMNAFIGKRRHVHASLLGTSTVTIGSDTELGTYLLGDVVLFPNLSLERQIVESDHSAASILVGAGAGALPLAFGFAIGMPREGAAGGAGAGVLWGSFQSGTLVVSARSPRNAYALSLNGGAFVMEGGFAGIGAVAGAGETGGYAASGAASVSTHRFGGTAGIEFDKTFGRHDALVIAADVWVIDPQNIAGQMSSVSGVGYPRVTWSHRFERWQLTGGVYTLMDLPKMQWAHDKMLVGPFFNVAWNWGRS